MKKWVWAFILMACVTTIFGCKSVTNLDNDPSFKPIIGKNLMTKKDLVVIDFKGSKKALALAMPGTSGVPDLPEIPTSLPFHYYGHVVHGIFPAGATFKVVHIEYVKTFEFSFTDFYAIVTSEGQFKGARIDIGTLTNQSTRVPTFDMEYVDEIPTAQ